MADRDIIERKWRRLDELFELLEQLDDICLKLHLLNEQRIVVIITSIELAMKHLQHVKEDVELRPRRPNFNECYQIRMNIFRLCVEAILNKLNVEVERQRGLHNINQAVIDVLEEARNLLQEMYDQIIEYTG